MNKKFSTLMAISLMALSTSAFAADVLPLAGSAAKKVEGKKYFLVQNVFSDEATKGIDSDDRILGMSKDMDDSTLSYDKATWNDEKRKFETTEGFSVNNYLWTVEEKTVEGTTNEYYYQFKNVATGELLRVLSSPVPTRGQLAKFENKVEDKDHYNSGLVSFALYKSDGSRIKYGADGGFFVPNAWTKGWKIMDFNAPDFGVYNYTSVPTNHTFQLYEATDVEVDAGVLNKLYNSNGFNFDLPDHESVTNLFNDGRVKAIQVPVDIYLKDGDVKMKESTSKYYIPKGTYFAVETPYGVPSWNPSAGDGNQENAEDLYEFLLNCTLIAVDPVENASNSASIRKTGEGFELTTVSGKDLNFFASKKTSDLTNADNATVIPSGSDISVYNACFTVKENINNANKYALSLARVSYQETTSSDAHKTAELQLAIKSNGSYGSSEYLVTATGATPNYIFKYVESNVKKAAELLNADGASIYNIQFVRDRYNYDTYLTEFGEAYYAKGEALVDLDAPAYQYLITKVNGNDVTFTNRETGKSFTTKLFEEGDDVYSIAMSSDKTYSVLDVNASNDIEASHENFSLGGEYIRLIPVAEVDKFHGYWNVADETKVTLAFARDFTPTSNKMYPVINTNKETGNKAIKSTLTDEVAEAAQWQLVKTNKGYPYYVTRTYAYLDANDKVVYKSKGDTVAYYAYQMQLVEDGNPVKWYMHEGVVGSASKYTVDQDDAQTFIIKENIDGSVSMLDKTDGIAGTDFLTVAAYYDAPKATVKEELSRALYHAAMQIKQKANFIKTYLVQDAPEVSLPATATYITLQSALGNYIAMNAENDGIVISNEPLTYRVFATDLDAVVPSFLISTGFNAEDKAREFLFNPEDSVNYYVGNGKYDKVYQWSEGDKKVLFKSGILSENNDTLTTSIKGKVVDVAMKADRYGTQAGLNRFKQQIVLADGEDDLYVIRQLKAGQGDETQYLGSINEKMAWVEKAKAMKFVIADTVSPTANEAIEATGVQVVGSKGAVTVQGAAGKVITVANILGQTIANQVAASDNVTIAVPAGIVVVAVEGEATKVVVK